MTTMLCPEGPSTQYFRTLVPNTTEGMAFGTRIVAYRVLGPSGLLSGSNVDLFLRVQSTQIWSTQGFYIRNRHYGFG